MPSLLVVTEPPVPTATYFPAANITELRLKAETLDERGNQLTPSVLVEIKPPSPTITNCSLAKIISRAVPLPRGVSSLQLKPSLLRRID